MRIIDVSDQPFHELLYSSAGQVGIEILRFPFMRASVDWLPATVDAIFVCSDLQGVIDFRIDGRANPEQLGISVAEKLFELSIYEEIAPAGRIGIILCGDLYTAPGLEKRGASGDARPVWKAFAHYFKWVVGVAGNHDLVTVSASDGDCQQQRMCLLDGNIEVIDDARIAGLGGIIGDPAKPRRRTSSDFVKLLKKLLLQSPTMLLMHQGPDVPKKALLGDSIIRAALEGAKSQPLTICGHVHWPVPLAELDNGIQVLNVDARGVLLERR